MNTEFTAYSADCRGNASNCLYPNKIRVDGLEAFRELVKHDHVFALFKHNYRSIENFLRAKSLPGDIDNSHSEHPEDWIYPKDIAAFFSGVEYYIHFSRHHMKQKGSESPRPRFHVVFPIVEVDSSTQYASWKQRMQKAYTFFDTEALDAARFFYGTEDPQVEYHEGSITLTEFLQEYEDEEAFTEMDNVIPEGKRNSTLSRFAGRLIVKYDDTEETHLRFLEEAEKCEVPLEDWELQGIWKSAQKFLKKVKSTGTYVSPGVYDGNATGEIKWETPIPFDEFTLPSFPVDALLKPVREYVLAVAESTQTPVDMSVSAALGILSICAQGKYRIRGKQDWVEPLNIYLVIIAEPSERKSAVISFTTKPLNEFEAEYNRQNAAALESSRMRKRILERRQKALEEQMAKGKAEQTDLDAIAEEIAGFKEKTPLRLYVDDITTEKLTSVLADGDGKAAIVSAEGGIFDMLSGLYTKTVNIDVLLKGHSGDSIRVDRIGRNSESIMNPALSVLLAVQPNVLSGMMQNGTFRGRGLTARFLYCMPTSYVGNRKYRTESIPQEVIRAYTALICNLLDEESNPTTENPEEIRLSPEADALLEDFANELEPKLRDELSDISDWAGKLVGAVLRISGILCRANRKGGYAFLQEPEPLIVDAETMNKAIAIGRYYTEHSKAAFSLMGADPVVKQCKYVLSAIKKNGLAEFTRRNIMRICRGLRTAEEVQPVLDRLHEYGYIAAKPVKGYTGIGRPTAQSYLVNPIVLSV